jgi:peptidyl-prolyl cis-trans isomerase C
VRTAAAALLLLALGFAGCRRPAPPAPDVAARLGGADVRYAQFESYLARAIGDSENVAASDVLTQLFDQFLDEQLLVRLAVDRGLARGADPRRAIDALLQQGLAAEPDEAQVAAYYRAHAREFARPERVRLRQILTEDRATAERALREVAAGADFAAVAARLSRDPSAAAGGDQGVLARGDLPPAFADVIFSLRPGEVSRVVPAGYGCHLFQVVERLPAAVAALPEVRGEIRDRLRRERADRRLAALVREGRKRYNVVVYERNLPFDYEGSYRDVQKAKNR